MVEQKREGGMLLPRCPNMNMFWVRENDGDAYVSKWEVCLPFTIFGQFG